MKRQLEGDRRLPPLKIYRQHQISVRTQCPPIPAVRYKRPVIIHTYSPEIIKTDSSNFMELVQRLTGPGSSPRTTIPRVKRAGTSSSPERNRAGLQPVGIVPYQPDSITLNSTSELQHSHERLPLIDRRKSFRFHEFSPREPDASGLSSNGKVSRSANFCPSLLPSRSPPCIDFPSLRCPAASPFPVALPSILPSPGPLTASFRADLPDLSTAIYQWIDTNYSQGDAKILSRASASDGLLPTHATSERPAPHILRENPLKSDDV